jgi:hypothetical protein
VVPLLIVVGAGIIGSYELIASHADTLSSPKASSPATNLKAYPKLPVQPLSSQVVTSSNTPDQTVTSYVQTSSTGGTYTSYDVAPGKSVEQLYKSLLAKGVKGLQDPLAPASQQPTTNATSQEVSSAAISGHPCAYGNARALCRYGTPYGQIHWQNNGYAHPQIYFVDHTSSAWPVDQATWTWNQAQGIDSSYQWATCPNYSGIHCVSVSDKNYGANGLGDGGEGQTTVVTYGDNIVGASSVLNDYYPVNAYGHRQAVCHEEGHVLGLDHNTSTSSCIYATITESAASQYPNSYDFALVANIYNTAH